ncbi:MAG: hypothetical protein ACKO9F_16685 [Caldilinea sp.]
MADPVDAIETIVELVRRLSPAQRRALVRRLAVSGLWSATDLATDQRRLAVAPALVNPGSTSAAPPQGRAAPPRPPEDPSTIRGHVVLGPPENRQTDFSPHQMAPLPGQAPEEAIVLQLRGVSPHQEAPLAEYVVRWPGYAPQVVQVRFSGNPTQTQAIYDLLEKALRSLLSRMQESRAAPATARLVVDCPSDQVIDELIGEVPVLDARVQTRHDRVVLLLDQFGDWQLVRTGG